MAYATLLSLPQLLEQILHPNDESLILPEAEQQIMRSLHKIANFLLSFLENDSLKYRESNLEPRIRDMAYEVEAMIVSGFLRQNYERLQKILEEFDFILEEVEKMKEGNLIEDLPPTKDFPTTSSKSRPTDKTVVGLHKEMMEIKDRLTGSPSGREIISIIGMPGIGKTTLAKALYDDPLIVNYFDVRAQITVSADYNQQQMLTDLLDSIQNISHGSYPEDLVGHLYKTLKQRRYLIVMDDVWNTNAWDQVKRIFPDDNNGSRVILTTRLQKVANYVECPDSIYHLSILSPDDSWKLLCRNAFKAEPCPIEFEGIGKEIANNCKGLPISLALVGGILYKAERTLDYWRYIAKNVNSVVLNDTQEQVMNILSLSYKYLPHHLRACFLYMGVFPEDHAISKSKLIRLWVAEGFIKPAPSKSLEEVALEYLKNLIDRNMIFIHVRNYAGRVKKCGIHDLMRDLCIRIAHDNKFLKVVHSQIEIPRDYTYNFRHVYIYSKSHACLAGIYGLLADSLTCSPTESPNTYLSSRVLNSRQLRVLDQAGQNPLFIPQDEIVVGLRYISFPCMERNYIHSSISKLSNLQTLAITSWKEVTLPSEIWMMPQIRHIKAKECFLPYPSDAEKIVPLENLQTLKGVINFRFTEDAIRMMPKLTKLGIEFHLNWSDDLSSYFIGNLVLLHQLQSLKISINDNSDKKHSLPENFLLPATLKKLTLDNFRLSPKNIGSIGSLQHLEELNLYRISFDGSLWKPTEGEFVQLKSLCIYGSTDLENLIADETNFPMLQSLRFVFCPELIDVPSGFAYIPTLQVIELSDCRKSAEDSVELIRVEQQDFGNDRLRVVFGNYGKLIEYIYQKAREFAM